MKNIFEKVGSGDRISFDEGFKLKSASLFELGKLANIRLRQKDITNEVGYISNRMINYSNICNARCKFCAYHAMSGKISAFKMTDEEILKIVDESVKLGAVQIMLQGGLHHDFTIEWACNLLKKIKLEYPQISLHVFSPSEIVYFAKNANISIDECIKILSEYVDSIPGAADLLVDRIRMNYSPLKCSVLEWKTVMRCLAKYGKKSSATMTFGMGEFFHERIEHLNIVREMQDELGIFESFIAWPLAPENTQLRDIRRVSANEFLKTIAISRIYLDNIRVIQSGWLTEGMKIAEMALHFGANDMGGILIDEMVVKSAGVENKTNSSGMENAIRSAGKIPFARTSDYKKI